MTPLLLLSAALSAPPADPPAVAFALEVRGAATVERGGEVSGLEDGDALREGDKLAVKAGAGVTVYFRPGGPVAVLNGPADAKVLSGKLDTAAAVAIREVKVPARAAAGLERGVKSDLIGGVTLRGPSIKPKSVSPVAGRAVRTDRPTFRWPGADGVKAYRFEISKLSLSRTGGEIEKKLWEVEATQPELAYPEGKKPLARGEKYHWRVTAPAADGGIERVADARFMVLDAATVADLATLAALEQSDNPDDWHIAAEAYLGVLLTEEPIRLFEKVAQKRPGSALVWSKLAKLYEATGQAAEEEKAKARYETLTAKK